MRKILLKPCFWRTKKKSLNARQTQQIWTATLCTERKIFCNEGKVCVL